MIEALLFLFGIHMMMLLLAACYRIVDLWYAISRHLPAIVLRLSLIVLASFAVALVLPKALLTYFIAGQLFYAAFHLIAHATGRGIAMALEKRLLEKNQGDK